MFSEAILQDRNISLFPIRLSIQTVAEAAYKAADNSLPIKSREEKQQPAAKIQIFWPIEELTSAGSARLGREENQK